MRLALALVLVAACAAPRHAMTASDVQAMFDRSDARLAAGDVDGFASIYADDAFVWGGAPGDVTVGRAALAAAFHATFDPLAAQHVTGTLVIARRKLSLAANGRAAWYAAEATFTLGGADGAAVSALHYRQLALAARDTKGRWRVLASHLSKGLGNDAAAKLAATLPAPAAIGDGVGPGAAPLVALMTAYYAHPETRRRAVATTPDVMVIGSDPDEWYEGRAFADVIDAHAQRTPPVITPEGGWRAGLAADGAHGWVATNVAFTIDGVTVRYRWLTFLELRDGVWTIVALHASNAIPDGEIT